MYSIQHFAGDLSGISLAMQWPKGREVIVTLNIKEKVSTYILFYSHYILQLMQAVLQRSRAAVSPTG